MNKCFVSWSIYVRTKSRRKLSSVHLPPIEQALGPIEFEWQVLVENENPDLFRIVNCQNLAGNSPQEIIIPVLSRAYRLADNWTISGLADLSAGELRHVMGYWKSSKPSRLAPALESVLFEIAPGQIGGRNQVRGWFRTDKPGQSLVVPDPR